MEKTFRVEFEDAGCNSMFGCSGACVRADEPNSKITLLTDEKDFLSVPNALVQLKMLMVHGPYQTLPYMCALKRY